MLSSFNTIGKRDRHRQIDNFATAYHRAVINYSQQALTLTRLYLQHKITNVIDVNAVVRSLSTTLWTFSEVRFSGGDAVMKRRVT